MQDIISTLKNALQQAEAGLEVAVGRLSNDGTERGDFKPSEVLALAVVREALATPVTCLHQIQEPAAAEQAAWHAGLDEGWAQAAQPSSVSNAETPQAAPAAVAVPDGWQLVPMEGTEEMARAFRAESTPALFYMTTIQCADFQERYRAMLGAAPALAATPAAVEADREDFAWLVVQEACETEPADEDDPDCIRILRRDLKTAVLAAFLRGDTNPTAAAPVVLPEPALHVSGGQLERHCDPEDKNGGRYIPARKTAAGLFTTPLFTEQKVRALLAQAATAAGCEVDPVQAAADAASVGHLSNLVDHQTALLARAMATMKAVELTASPIDESDGDLDARIPYEAWSTFVDARAALLHDVAQSPVAAPQAQADARDAEQPRLTVRLISFPESNGKRNWTAMFMRSEKFDGLIGNAGGITIARGECWNRVAYHAEEARFLLGERGTEPDIMAYGDDVHTPHEWSGEDADGVFAAIAAAKGK